LVAARASLCGRHLIRRSTILEPIVTTEPEHPRTDAEPATAADADPAPADQPTTTTTQRRRPSRNTVLGLLGAFLLGACLCGGAGIVAGAVISHHHDGGRHGQDNDRGYEEHERWKHDGERGERGQGYEQRERRHKGAPAPTASESASPGPAPSVTPTS
jgi:hypothetical protein